MMSTTTPVGDVLVKKVIEVAAPQAIAFRVFTEEMSGWWPLESHHIGKAKAVASVVEPKVGGRWYERGEDGSECSWGQVLAWDPPRRLVLAWQISADWQFDAALWTEVEVQFISESPSRTRVVLEHRRLNAYGPRAEEMKGVFDSEGGWSGLLRAYAERTSGSRA